MRLVENTHCRKQWISHPCVYHVIEERIEELYVTTPSSLCDERVEPTTNEDIRKQRQGAYRTDETFQSSMLVHEGYKSQFPGLLENSLIREENED